MCISNYDNAHLGTENSLHPANQSEVELELSYEEQLEDENAKLQSELNEMRTAFAYRKAVNAKIVEILKGAYAMDYKYLHNKLDELL